MLKLKTLFRNYTFVIIHFHFFIIAQIVDDVLNKCVYPDQCSCSPCDPVSANCSNIIETQNDTCGCPICGGTYYIVYDYGS